MFRRRWHGATAVSHVPYTAFMRLAASTADRAIGVLREHWRGPLTPPVPATLATVFEDKNWLAWRGCAAHSSRCHALCGRTFNGGHSRGHGKVVGVDRSHKCIERHLHIRPGDGRRSSRRRSTAFTDSPPGHSYEARLSMEVSSATDLKSHCLMPLLRARKVEE